MDITRYFLHFRRPPQYVYGGENHVEIYRPEKRGEKRVTVIENMSLFKLDNTAFDELKRELLDVETGIVLNSAQFIFNIFEFEKIPLREDLVRDLVQWRLQKVFPEDMELYEHEYYRLDRRRILSLLFKKSQKEKLEELFVENGVKLVHLGNSTVEIMNSVRSLKPCPDFFIEIDQSLCMVVFLNRGVPFYIRKFRSSREADLASEVQKTVTYVTNNYALVPRAFLLAANSPGLHLDSLREQLAAGELTETAPKSGKKKLHLPGR